MGYIFLMFGIPIAIIAGATWFVFRRIRIQQEKVYAPLDALVQAFARQEGYISQKVPLYRRAGLKQLERALPVGLAKENGRSRIPMYSQSTEHRGMYRSAYILQKVTKPLPHAVYILPMFATADGIQGVCFVAAPMPLTMHWLKLQTDATIHGYLGDHELESNTFNKKYQLAGSDPKLLTEVFDPLLIERYNAYRGGKVFMRIRIGFAEIAIRGLLTDQLLRETVQTLKITREKFLQAMPAHPEPKRITPSRV